MKNLRYLTLLIGLILFSSCQKKASIQPNVILIYADDLGRGLLSCYGQEIIETPNIDKLANGGMRFNNAYGAMVCATARASLLTGMHDCNSNVFNVTRGRIYMNMDVTLSYKQIKEQVNKVAMPAKENEVFLGQAAQNAGYTTAEFGKLEWGFATTPERIERHGWDYHFGYYDHARCHGFYPPFLFENGKKVKIEENYRVDCGKSQEPETNESYSERWNMEGKKQYSQNVIMDKLLSFIDSNDPTKTNNPFFIYFPTQLPHGPVMIPEVHPDFANNPNLTAIEKEYASMVKMLDTDVGRIFKKLEDLNILDNTIIVLTSDNGHEIYYTQEGRVSKSKKDINGVPFTNISNKYNSQVGGDIFNGNDGMSGLKRSNWEGGVRVPLIWYWKDKIKAGTVSDRMVGNYDFMNTLSELIGGKQYAEKDGISYAPLLFDKDCKTREYTVFASVLGPAIVSADGWKLRYQLKDDIFQLYYLPNDYTEDNNLLSQHPDKAEQLKEILYNECDKDWKNGLGMNSVNYQ